MDRMRERMLVAENAWQRFAEVLAILEPSAVERDAGIQRFEFTFEAVWKAAKSFLYNVEGLDMGSPKSAIRACREIGILTAEQTVRALQMVDDRNLTVHTYNEALAVEIYGRLQGYSNILQVWLQNMQTQECQKGRL